MLDSVNQQTPERNKGERKAQIGLESTRIENEITGIRKHTSTISLHLNGLKSQIKGHTLADWIKQYDPILFILSVRDTTHWQRHTEWR
jgi:hypothetical protein